MRETRSPRPNVDNAIRTKSHSLPTADSDLPLPSGTYLLSGSYVVVYGGVRWCMVVYSCVWRCMVVYGGVRRYAVMCNGVWWCNVQLVRSYLKAASIIFLICA